MIYKFIDNNGSEITVNSLSSLQQLVDSETVKKDTKVKAGLRGKWTTAKKIPELFFEKEKKEEEIEETIEPEEDIKTFISKQEIKEEPKEEITTKKKKEPIVKELVKEETEVPAQDQSEEPEKEIEDTLSEEPEKEIEDTLSEEPEKEIEDTLPEKPEKGKDKPHEIIGGILIAIGVADFVLSWFGINLTFFLPPDISRFSPIAFTVVGGIIMSAGDK